MSEMNNLVLAHASADHIIVPQGLVDELNSRFGGPDARWLPLGWAPGQMPPLPRFLGTFEGNGARIELLSEFEVRQLVSLGKLRDVSKLPLNEKSLERQIRKMAGASREGLDDLWDITGVLDFDEPAATVISETATGGLRQVPPTEAARRLDAGVSWVAQEFAALAEQAPDLVRLAFQGRLFEAAARVRSVGYRLASGHISREAVFDLLETLGRYHVVESLLISADDAVQRIFETTGFAFLDENGDAKTTKGCILKRMDRQLHLLLQALKLYSLKRDIDLGEPGAKPFRDENLLDQCRRLEEALVRIHGEQTGEVLAATLKSLHRRIVNFRRGLKTLSGQHRYRALAAWTDRGPNPLHMLWLNASTAIGWLDVCHPDDNGVEKNVKSGDVRGRRFIKRRMTRLRFALEQAAGNRIVEPRLHHSSAAELVGRLYFTLRHIEVRDPDSVVVKRLRKDDQLTSLLDAFRVIHQEQAVKHAGQEPWSADVATDARKEYELAKDPRSDRFDPAFVAEAQGCISIRLSS